MHAKIRTVRAELLGGDGELDRLAQRSGAAAHLRVGRRRSVPE